METKRLLIRQAKIEDATDLYEARNSEFVLKYNAMEHISKEDFTSQIQKDMSQSNVFYLEDKVTKKAIGVIHLSDDSLRYQVGTKEISYWLAENYANQGYMSEALETVISYLFTKGIEGISARCFKPNQASISLLNKLGFKKEGCLHHAVKGYRGIIYDDVLFYLKNSKINYVYILKCKNGNYYTGWTNNLQNRLMSHNQKSGAKYTKAFGPCGLVYYETYLSKEEAMKREYQIKQLTRKQKEALIYEQ